MKKNNLLPILLVAGAGVVAYMYFKKKGAAKEIADGVDVEPQMNKGSNDDQNTTSSEDGEGESKGARLIKTASSIYKGARQVFKGRKKRKSRVIIEPTESSSTPFAETATTRKNRRLAKRTARKTARTTRRSARRNKKVLTGFEF
jgi:ABC-type Na+ efflux pump permease subunit